MGRRARTWFHVRFHSWASFRATGMREWSTYVGSAVLLGGIGAVVFMSEEQVSALARKATLAVPAVGAILLLLRQHHDGNGPGGPGGQA